MQPQLIAGRYQVLRAIGRGGMGTVWLCRDEVLGRKVAVKQIGGLPGGSATETRRALREARSAAALNHPNAVAVFDVVDHDGRPWLVMEYVEGQTLADEIMRDGHLSPERVADVGAQLAGALARAHERRIVHRDIKPGNVLIDKAGRPKISDFGIARGQGDDQLTQIGFITGTPGYLSPELARGGDPGPASDVWALGATLYAAVEGRGPYEPRSNPIALLRAIASERPRPMGSIASAQATLVMARVDPPGNKVVAAPPVERTRRLEVPTPATAASLVEPTKRFQARVPVTAEPPVGLTRRLEVPAPVPSPPVEPTKRIQAPGPPLPRASRPELSATSDSHSDVQRSDDGPPRDRSSVRRWMPLAFVALLVAVLGLTYLSHLGDPGGPTSVADKARVTTAAKTAGPTPSTTAAQGANATKNLASFLSSYYSDVTKDTNRTWGRLTPKMQQAAGGRRSYDGFWRTITKVKVNRTQANGAATRAVVSLTFTRRGGTKSTENHQFTFVNNDAGFLIASDTFLG